MNTLQFPPRAADQRDYEKLLTALGSENNPSQWLEFMDAVSEVLPEILSTGRPSKTAIAGSLIGRLGFASWKEMIEAPVDAGGLGWSDSGWKAFKRAYNTVQKWPYLREKDLRSGWINKYANQWRDDFPADGAAFDVRVAQMAQDTKDKRRERQEQEVLLLQQQVESLSQQLVQAQTTISQQEGAIHTLKEASAALSDARERCSSLETQVSLTKESLLTTESQLSDLRTETEALRGELATAQQSKRQLDSKLARQPQSFGQHLAAAAKALFSR